MNESTKEREKKLNERSVALLNNFQFPEPKLLLVLELEVELEAYNPGMETQIILISVCSFGFIGSQKLCSFSVTVFRSKRVFINIGYGFSPKSQ